MDTSEITKSIKDEEKALKDKAKAEEKALKDTAKAEEKALKDKAKAEEKTLKDTAKAEEKTLKDTANAEEKAVKDKAKAEEKAVKDKANAEEKAVKAEETILKNNIKQIKQDYDKFLSIHKTSKGDEYNHIDLFKKQTFFIPDEQHKNFVDLYCKNIDIGTDLHIVEKPSHVSPLRLDFDFKFKIINDVVERKYTINTILKIIEDYHLILNEMFDTSTELTYFVMEKKKPTVKDAEYKDGIHIIVPELLLTYDEQFYIRDKIIASTNAFVDLDCINDIQDIVDIAIIKQNNWQLYGSKKPYCNQYYVTEIGKEDDNGNIVLEKNENTDNELVKLLSMNQPFYERKHFMKTTNEDYQEWVNKRIEKTVKKTLTEKDEPFTSEKIQNNLKWLENIVTHFDRYEASQYTLWFNMIGCLVNCCNKLQLTENNIYKICHIFSSISDKYDDTATEKLIDKFVNTQDDNDKNKYGFPYLKERLKHCNKEFYDEMFPANMYKEIKKIFEEEVCKINEPYCFIRKIDEQSKIVTETQLLGIYKNKKCFLLNDDKKIEKDFIKEWLYDEHNKTYERMICDPERKERKNEKNMWNGFYAEMIPEVGIEIESEVETDLKKHFDDVFSNGDDAITTFIMDWIANRFQNPSHPAQVAIFAKGKQGDGKDLPFEFVRYAIGQEYSFDTDKTSDIFDRFSTGSVNKVFIQFHEANGADIIGNNRFENIKNLITSETVNYEKKGIDPMECKNMVDIFFSSNNQNAMPIPSDDRRFMAVETSSIHRRKEAYFDPLIEKYSSRATKETRDKYARGLYQLMKKRDLSRYSHGWQQLRPMTPYYNQIKKMNLNPVNVFLSYKCIYVDRIVKNDDPDSKTYNNVLMSRDFDVDEDKFDAITATMLFAEFNKFKSSRHMNSDLSSTKFGRIMGDFQNHGIDKFKSGCVNYAIDYEKLTNYMKENHLLDDDVY